MDLKSSFTLEVLKNENNKYVFCVIKIIERATTYFFGQDKPHITRRWLQPHHWAAFDAKICELSARNTFNHITEPLHFELIESVVLMITKANISIDLLCKTITDIEIAPEDVIAVIECKLEYHERRWENIHYKETCHHSQKNVSKEKTPKEIKTPSKGMCVSPRKEISDLQNITFRKHETEHGTKSLFRENASHENVTSSNRKTKHNLRSIHRENGSQENFSVHKRQLEFAPSSLNKKTHCQENLSPPMERIEQSPRSLRKKHCREKTSSSKQEDCKELNRVTVLSSLDEDESYLKKVTPPSPFKKTVSKKLAKSPMKYDDKLKLFSESDKTDNILCKRKKRKETIDSSDSSDDSQDERNIGKALAVLNRNEEKTKELTICSNFVDDQESTRDGLVKKKSKLSTLNEFNENTKTKTPTTPKSIADSSKSISKKKKSEIKLLNCQETRSMNEWLHKKTPRSNKEKTDLSDKPKVNSPSSLSKAEIQSLSSQSPPQEEKEMQLAIMRTEHDHVSRIARILKDMTPAKTEFLDLMKLGINEIIKTFDEYQPKLDDLFYKFDLKSRKKKWNNEVNHYLVMDLLSSSTQLCMMNKLSDRYERVMEGLPKYGEFFSMVLMPEWILSIFMKKYNMTRAMAIKHIKAQKAYKIYTQSELRLDDTLMG